MLFYSREDRNNVWFFGRNPFLSSYSSDPSRTLKPHQLVTLKIQEQPIKQVSSDEKISSILFANGEVLEFINGSTQKLKLPKIKKILLSFEKEILLSQDGDVFIRNYHYSPKHEDTFIEISSLIEDSNDRKIIDFTSGRSSIYLLTSNQNAYGFGSNEKCQLGLDSKTLKKAEKPVLMMQNVTKIYSGIFSNSVFLLDSNQEIFGCGLSFNGQLGLGEIKAKESYVRKPMPIQNIPKGKIINIHLDHYYSLILIENKESGIRTLYSSGSHEIKGIKKQPTKTEFSEVKINALKNDSIFDFYVGFYHILILTSKGNLIGYGSNRDGQLGLPKRKFYPKFIQIKLPELSYDIFNYNIYCGQFNSILYYPLISSLEEDLIQLFKRKEFCDISFKTINGENIEAHKLILQYRIKEGFLAKFEEFVSQKSIQEANQIFEMIYSNNPIINTKLYQETKEFLNKESLIQSMKRMYLNSNENEKDFIIQRKEKSVKFPKIILSARSELYRGMFLSVTEDKSNKVNDYSELSDESFEILEYWIYTNQIKKRIQITKEMLKEIERGMDYFQLNQANPNLFSLLYIEYNKRQEDEDLYKKNKKKKNK
ncbi:btk-binding protein-related [Anaeramoeba ignava]|uniref:Btk-binding protein-related n=1 Tax=Anaeramoeba ignava TaxID=1746090 RepID=A0A9Q0LJY3_ANAIG|nr:btk-binding protein-related [Anaeramoeba ignava]